jgi:hypothetical protein
VLPLWSFQGARELGWRTFLPDIAAEASSHPPHEAAPGAELRAGLSKLNSVHVEVDVVPGEPVGRTASKEAIDGTDACGSKSSRIP